MATLLKRRPLPAKAPPIPQATTVQAAVSSADTPVRKGPKRVVPIVPKQIEYTPKVVERNGDGYTYAETIQRYKDRVRNPLTAIRAKCVECSNGSLKEVTECRVVHCALHPFREGRNPLHAKSRERRAEAEGGPDSAADGEEDSE
jgi:uncharacterized protein YgbK (DUF1537 family)